MEWRLEWWESAECAQVDRDVQDCFFPDPDEDTEEVITRKEFIAQVICSGCIVKDECLLYAIETNERYGVWGMHTQADRRELKRWMSRHPDKVGYHWDRSFKKITERIEETLRSTLNGKAAEAIALTTVEFGHRLIEDETLVVR